MSDVRSPGENLPFVRLIRCPTDQIDRWSDSGNLASRFETNVTGLAAVAETCLRCASLAVCCPSSQRDPRCNLAERTQLTLAMAFAARPSPPFWQNEPKSGSPPGHRACPFWQNEANAGLGQPPGTSRRPVRDRALEAGRADLFMLRALRTASRIILRMSGGHTERASMFLPRRLASFRSAG